MDENFEGDGCDPNTGEDGKFSWADAVIEGKTIIVSRDKVSKPVAVSYVGQHAWANLFNKDGLPALSFRTEGQ